MTFSLRFWDSFCYAVKCRRAEKRNDKVRQEKFYRLMLKEDEDSALLRIFEFLESAPQQVLQLTGLLLGTPVATKGKDTSPRIFCSNGILPTNKIRFKSLHQNLYISSDSGMRAPCK